MINNEQEREKDHINRMKFYLLDKNFQNVSNNSLKHYFLGEFENVKKELKADKTSEFRYEKMAIL